MIRLFLDNDLACGQITVCGDKAHYLSSVVRCNAGEMIFLCDRRGGSYLSRILTLRKKQVVIDVIEKQETFAESKLNLKLFQGVLKGEKMDLVVQKATELGVKEILPVITERSQIRETKKTVRWRRIAEEAARQSGRCLIPVIHDTVEFGKLSESGIAVKSGIIFWEQGGQRLSTVLQGFSGSPGIILFTGPEGGFSEREVHAANEMGLVPASLGKRILRAETAAITAVAITQYVLGDLDPLP